MDESAGFRGRVLLVEDDEFTRNLVTEGLNGFGVETISAHSIASAIVALETFDPNVVICDLNLGPGPSGAAFLARIAEEQPWVGLIALTAHASPELAIRDGRQLPASVIYVVKSKLLSVADLLPIALASIVNTKVDPPIRDGDLVQVTRAQAEVLRLIAEGLSNSGIAQVRGSSLSAAESQVQRLFGALGLEPDANINQRVLAVRMWQQGLVIVK